MPRRTITGAAALLCLALAAPLASGADGDGKYALRGAGVLRCADFLKAEQGRLRDWYLIGGWIDGYLSALNQRSPDTYDLAPWQDTEALTGLIRQSCARDPKQWFFAVVGAMTRSLAAQRLEQASKRVAANAGKRRVALYREVLVRVQRRLAKLGHYAGAADGAYGPHTRAAVAAYQKAAGLAVSGLPDQATLWALLGGAKP